MYQGLPTFILEPKAVELLYFHAQMKICEVSMRIHNKQLVESDTLQVKGVQVSWQEVTKQCQPLSCCLSTFHFTRHLLLSFIGQTFLIQSWSK